MREYLLYLDTPDTTTGLHEALLMETPDFDGDWWARYFPAYVGQAAEACRVEGRTPQGALWEHELCSGGADYRVFVAHDASTSAIKQSIAYLRGNYDVVGVSLIRTSLPQSALDAIIPLTRTVMCGSIRTSWSGAQTG